MSEKLIQLFEPIFEGSIEEGVEEDGIRYRRARIDDLFQLTRLESFYPGELPLTRNDLEQILNYFPELVIVAEDMETKTLIGSTYAIQVSTDGAHPDTIARDSDQSWDTLFDKQEKGGYFHELAGIVVDPKFRTKRIEKPMAMFLVRAIVENTLKDESFHSLTWSSSNEGFPKAVALKLKERGEAEITDELIAALPKRGTAGKLEAKEDEALKVVTRLFNELPVQIREQWHGEYVDPVLDGEAVDTPLWFHAFMTRLSGGKIRVTDKNVYCKSDDNSLGMGVRFDGTELIKFLFEWRQGLIGVS